MSRRIPTKQNENIAEIQNPSSEGIQIDRSKWFDSIETAIYLKRFKKDGTPSVGAIRNLVYRGKLRARKFLGRLMFNRNELDRLILMSPTVGG